MHRCPLGKGKSEVLRFPVRVELDFGKYYGDSGPRVLGREPHPMGKRSFLDLAEIGKRDSVRQGGAMEVRPEDLKGLGMDPEGLGDSSRRGVEFQNPKTFAGIRAE
jgi:hypothetical protein